MNMTDKAIIEWVHETLGFGWSREKNYSKRPKHYKRQWRWSCGYRDALKFAKLLWPYAQIKLHKLEQIIDHYEPRAQELGDNVVDLETEERFDSSIGMYTGHDENSNLSRYFSKTSFKRLLKFHVSDYDLALCL